MKIHGTPPTSATGQPFPLSAAVEAGGLVFLSGQVPMVDGTVRGDGIEEQTHIVIDNIAATLATAGLTLGHIVKATVWLIDVADFAGFNRAYAKRLGAPYPARSTVVSALALPGARIEIEVVAARGPVREVACADAARLE